MKVKRAIEIENQLLIRLKDEFSATIIYQRNLDAHIQAVKRSVFDSELLKRCPRHVRAFLQGAEKILWDNLYAGKDAPLVYVIVGPDKKQFGPGNDDWLKESSEYKSAMTGMHVWRKGWENGEVKSW